MGALYDHVRNESHNISICYFKFLRLLKPEALEISQSEPNYHGDETDNAKVVRFN